MSPVLTIRGSTLCHSTFNGLCDFDRIFFERILTVLFCKKKLPTYVSYYPKIDQIIPCRMERNPFKKGSDFSGNIVKLKIKHIRGTFFTFVEDYYLNRILVQKNLVDYSIQ